jgi:hypothetical protein|uniref:C2H2-type domain-containing protein n=2 Tax=viral metagenome TaxID=1070528 RepID=A0A6C0J1C6_9ZZZZ
MSFICKYCDKEFTLQGNLLKHQKTTKYCIKIQKERSESVEDTDIKSFNCEYCKKNFTTKNNLSRHYKSCIEKYKKLLSLSETKLEEKDKHILNLEQKNRDLEEQLKIVRLEVENEMYKERTEKLESTVEEMAKQPKHITNNQNKIIIAAPLDLSRDSITEALQNFSDNHLIQGQKGVAKFAYDNMLKDKDGKLIYICTDPSRQIFQYKNDQGKIEKDVRATRLTQALLEADIKQTSHKIAWDNMKDGDNEVFMTYTNHYQDIQELEQDNSKFSKELCCLTAK